ncbi:MAG: PDZ domain-containing protein [Kofleriaceae bacterium]
MRLRTSLLIGLVLVGTAPVWSAGRPVAHAEDRGAPARVGKVGLRVSEVFPESRQALVIDVATGKRVLVGEGDRVGAYQVVEIGDGEVVVRSGARELVLVADAAPAARPAGPTPPGPLDPYASPTRTGGDVAVLMGPMPIDPYAAVAPAPTGPIREVIAPAAIRAGGGPVDPYAAVAPTPPGPAAPPVIAPSTPPSVVSAQPTPSVVSAQPTPATPTPAAPATPAVTVDKVRVETMTIKRTELSASLGDFDQLARELGFKLTAGGVRVATVREGTYFYRLGLRGGDVITSIDGAPLRGLDDAAGAYARLGSASRLTLGIDRGGAVGTLRFALK